VGICIERNLRLKGREVEGSAGSRWTAASIVQVFPLPLTLEILLTLAHESAPSLRCAKILLQFEIVLEYITLRRVSGTRIGSHRLVKVLLISINLAISDLDRKHAVFSRGVHNCVPHKIL
jgi:hypothetical protein